MCGFHDIRNIKQELKHNESITDSIISFNENQAKILKLVTKHTTLMFQM